MDESKHPLLEDEVVDESDASDMSEDYQHVIKIDTKRDRHKLQSKHVRVSIKKMVLFAIITVFLFVTSLSIYVYIGCEIRNQPADWINGLNQGWSKVYDNYGNFTLYYPKKLIYST